MLIDCIGGSLLKKYFRGISFYILLFVVILMIFTLYNLPDKAGQKVYSDLISLIEQGQVKELEIIDLKAIATLLDDSRIEVNIPSMGILYIDVGDQIKSQMAEGTLRVNTPPPPTPPWWITILPTLGLVVFFILFWVFFLQQSQGGGGGRVMSFGRSRA